MKQQVQLIFDMGFWQWFAIEYLPASTYMKQPLGSNKPGENALVALGVSRSNNVEPASTVNPRA